MEKEHFHEQSKCKDRSDERSRVKPQMKKMYLIQDTKMGEPGTCTSAPMAIEKAQEQRDSITLEELTRDSLSTLKKKLFKSRSSHHYVFSVGNPTTRFSASKLVYSSLSSANKRNPERGAGEMKGCSLLASSSLVI